MAFAKSLGYFMFFLFVELRQEYLNWNNNLGIFCRCSSWLLKEKAESMPFRLQTCVQNSWAHIEIWH